MKAPVQKRKNTIALGSALLLAGAALAFYLTGGNRPAPSPSEPPVAAEAGVSASVSAALAPSPVRGNPAAKVTIEEFSDFQ